MVLRGRNHAVHALFGHDRSCFPAVVFGLDAFGEATPAQSPTMMRKPTALPPDGFGSVTCKLWLGAVLNALRT
jgi:hypothetical protein